VAALTPHGEERRRNRRSLRRLGCDAARLEARGGTSQRFAVRILCGPGQAIVQAAAPKDPTARDVFKFARVVPGGRPFVTFNPIAGTVTLHRFNL